MYRTLPAIVHETGSSHTPTALKFEITLGFSDTKSASAGDTAHSVEPSQQKPSINKTIDVAPICSIGPEAHLNLMVPDRFVQTTHSVRNSDASFTVRWIFALHFLIIYHFQGTNGRRDYKTISAICKPC